MGMKIALYQGPSSSQQHEQDTASLADRVTANLDVLAERAAEAGAQGARLLIVPEMFLTGYHIGADATRELAEAADGPAATRVAEIAEHTGTAILYGYPERAGDRIYNAAQLIDSDGSTLTNYRKTHLFGDIDRGVFTAGDGPSAVVDVGGYRMGILICYDVEFPENVRLLALAGADLLAVPTALMKPYEFIPRALVPARAYENQLFLAYCNRCGQEQTLEYYGESCITGPDGRDLARAGESDEMIMATLERKRLAQSRALNTYLDDRRPGLYRGLSDFQAGATP